MNDESITKAEKPGTLSTIRKILLAILLLGLLGSGAELLLLNHVDGIAQWVPLLLIVLSLVVLGWHGLEPGRMSTRAIQGTMIAFIAAGFTGFYFHYQGGVEFKLESNPSLRGWALFREAIQSKAPPALAPGVMIQLGLIGFAYTYRHPALLAPTKDEVEEKRRIR
jgi:hypothetical protein